MVQALLHEAATTQGLASKYLHIGGDEVKFDCWKSDPRIAAHVAEVYGDLSPASFSKLQAVRHVTASRKILFPRRCLIGCFDLQEWTANVSSAAAVAAGKRPVLWQPTTKGPGDPAWDNVLPADSVYKIWLNAASVMH